MKNALRPAGCPLFLASVTNAEEARTALSGGASIIDCKDPQTGALGALPPRQIEAIVRATDGRVPVSATIGDLPSDARIMVDAACAIAATGVDIVKIGFFDFSGAKSAIAALGNADVGRCSLFAVLMADRAPDFSIVPLLADAGFIGVMLDTADKRAGALPELMTTQRLAAFLDAARANGLRAGLAGSLRIEHISALAQLQPDILGFRGALCDGGRTAALNAARIASVRNAIDGVSARYAGAERLSNGAAKRSVA
jgi:(5-formylfuran-3-yl)methyl phosphate synthase